VTIYRLITRSTYEETLINTANHKSGLNEAILGNINLEGNPEENAKRIASLLRDGANLLKVDETESAARAAQFQQQDIGDILAQRTSKRTLASKAGSTFSTASFQAHQSGGQPVDDARFWSELLPEAVKAHQETERNKNLVQGKRRRKHVNYRDGYQPVRPPHNMLPTPANGASGRHAVHATFAWLALHGGNDPTRSICLRVRRRPSNPRLCCLFAGHRPRL
jgi:Domain of Unknown Function (DUF1087)